MSDPSESSGASTGNLSIGDEFTVETGYTVTPQLVTGDFNRFTLPGIYGPFPPEILLWGTGNSLLWGGVLQW
jgi:hypothetical protein